MSSCCSSPGNDAVFTAGVGRRSAWRYRRLGLVRRERIVVDAVAKHGVQDATVVEIGGGVGQLQLALLDRGAGRAVNLELSPHYEHAAARLAADQGHAETVERRLGDAAHLLEPLPDADVAILHRVVCCTDDWRGMLDAALATDPSIVVVTLPHDGVVPRILGAIGNRLLALTGGSFRMRHHPPAEVMAHLRQADRTIVSVETGVFWRTLVAVR